MAGGARRPAPPAPEDIAQFRAAVADAVPLAHDRVLHERPLPAAIPHQTLRDARAALAESLCADDLIDLQLDGGDEAAWRRNGVPRVALRDLRRGRWARQDKLDLHGLTRDQARQAVGEFLASCGARGLRCVRIVHGKGIGSPGREPVLKNLVQGWLSQRRDVLAFCQARAAEGGAGAVVVLLSVRHPSAPR